MLDLRCFIDPALQLNTQDYGRLLEDKHLKLLPVINVVLAPSICGWMDRHTRHDHYGQLSFDFA